jgi:DNA repair exonuclease SbcCD nuclease subunit
VFPVIVKNNIKTIIQLGDTFDRRKYINFYTLNTVKKRIFDKLQELGVVVYSILGNHDIYFRNTIEINSPELLLKEYDNWFVVNEPMQLNIDDITFALVPWIAPHNRDAVNTYIDKSTSEYLVGHFEFAGFEMQKGIINTSGHVVGDMFKKFHTVFSGHYHHESKQNNIHYLCTPYEITWSDFDDNKGYYLFDTSNKELEFIQNHDSLYHKIVYDDTTWLLKEVKNFNYKMYANRYIKLIIKKKSKISLFNMFMEMLNDAEPLDIVILNEEIITNNESSVVVEDKSTLEIINSVVDQFEDLGCAANDVKQLMYALFNEAQNGTQ